MKIWNDFKKEMMKDQEFKDYCDETQGVYDVSMALIVYRSENDIKQKELSVLTGVPVDEIKRIESLDANPNLKTLAKLAKGMGKKVRIVFEDR